MTRMYVPNLILIIQLLLLHIYAYFDMTDILER